MEAQLSVNREMAGPHSWLLVFALNVIFNKVNVNL